MNQAHTNNNNAIQVAHPKDLAKIMSHPTTPERRIQPKREDYYGTIRQKRKVRAYELPLL
jgi:hypothetical protein